MHAIELYAARLEEWDIAWISKQIFDDDRNLIGEIKDPETLHRKYLSKYLCRSLLSQKCGIEPSCLEFGYNQRGKPFVKNHPDLHFNISHSGSVILLGISDRYPIGVDVEHMKQVDEADEILKYVLSASEFEIYQTFRSKGSQAFFQFWTLKEAIVKAFGKGIWEADHVPEIFCSGKKFALRKNHRILDNWSCKFIDLYPSYMACIVVNSPDFSLNLNPIKRP